MERLIQQLKSSDRAERKAAIIALGKTKDPAALKPLGEAYKTETDPELRQLALDAGKYIKNAVQTAPPPSTSLVASEPPSRFDDIPGPGYEIIEPKEQPFSYVNTIHIEGEVSERDEAKAKMYLDRAMDFHMRKDSGRAAENLIKAVEVNPRLKANSVAQGLAGAITHQPPERAFEFLMNPAASNEFIAQKKKEAPSGSSTSENFGTVLLDLVILTVITMVGMVILIVLLFQKFDDPNSYYHFDSTDTDSVFYQPPQVVYDPNTGTYYNQAPEVSIEDIVDPEQLRNAGIPIALVVGIVSGGLLSLWTVILSYCINFVATTLAGGVGSTTGLMKRLVPAFTIFNTLTLLLYIVGVVGDSAGIYAITQLLSTPLGLVSLAVTTYLIMKSYNFGVVNSCSSYCLGSIAAGLVVGCCYIGFVTAALSAFGLR